MRYFYQDKTYVPQFDEETQIVVETADNNITWSWNVITPEHIAYRVVKHGENETKFVDEEHSTPEVGEWVYESAEGYAGDGKEAPSVVNAHDKDIEELEVVSIVRDLTEEEIAERQREKERQEEEQRQAQERAEQLDNYIKTDDDEIALNTDVPNSAATGGGPFVKVNGKGAYASQPGVESDDESIATTSWVRQLIAEEMKKAK